MATKVNINLNNIDIKIKDAFHQAINDKKLLNEIGKFSVKRMQSFARKEQPLQSKKVGSFPVRYPRPLTIQSRLYIASRNKTHRTFVRSGRGRNLTITGQLLDGINYLISGSTLRFQISGSRKAYKGHRSNPSNESIYQSLLSRNKKFKVLGMDAKGIKRINNMIKRQLRLVLRNRGFNK